MSKDSSRYIFIFIFLATIVVGLWYGSTVYMASIYASLGDRGVAGDQFGAINALFSGLAFAGLITTLLLQRKELEMQREELKLTREEHKGAKKQLENQNESLSKQNFERTFFDMLRLHHTIVDGLRFGKTENQREGRVVFNILCNNFTSIYTRNTSNKNLNIDILKSSYNTFFESNGWQIGHYFRNLYRIVKYIDEQKISNKDFYIGILRAQLSSNELFLLFYNGASDLGEKKFKPLIEKYSLLENITLTKIEHPHVELRFYKKSAFGDDNVDQYFS